MFNNFFLNRNAYEKMWKNIAEPERPQMTIWCMRIACCVYKATITHTYYAMINAFPPLQELLYERASTFCYTYIACPVSPYFCNLHCK
jgi:hypothetical protein